MIKANKIQMKLHHYSVQKSSLSVFLQCIICMDNMYKWVLYGQYVCQALWGHATFGYMHAQSAEIFILTYTFGKCVTLLSNLPVPVFYKIKKFPLFHLKGFLSESSTAPFCLLVAFPWYVTWLLYLKMWFCSD